MEKELDTVTGDYTGRSINNLKNAVYIRLKTPLGSWWADKKIGSLLHLLEREKDIDRVGLKKVWGVMYQTARLNL